MQLYSRSYNAMDKAGLIPDRLDQNFEPENDGNKKADDPNHTLTAEEEDMKKL